MPQPFLFDASKPLPPSGGGIENWLARWFQDKPGRAKKVVLDTITTRFLMLFIIVLVIPLFSLILFTLSLLQGYQQQAVSQQEVMIETTFRKLFEGKQHALDTVFHQFHLDHRETPRKNSRKNLRKNLIDQAWLNFCGSQHNGIPEGVCFVFHPQSQTLVLPDGGEASLVEIQKTDPGFAIPLDKHDTLYLFYTLWHGNLYLFRREAGSEPEDSVFMAGVPIREKDIRLIFQENPILMTHIGMVIDTGNMPLKWSFYVTPGNAPIPPVRQFLPYLPESPLFDRTLQILNKPYQISQLMLSNCNHQRIARLVSLLPMEEQQAWLSRYYIGIYIVLVAGLLLSVGLAVLAARTITQPLLSLIDQVRKLSRSQNTDLRVVAKGVYEINELTAAFNQMLDRLNQEHRMKDEFVATLTHDLKVPLLAEKQTLQYLEKNTYGMLNETQREIIHILFGANQANLNLVNGILEIYRYESGQARLNYSAFDLAALLEEIVQALHPLAEDKSIALSVHGIGDAPINPCFVEADRLEIRRVLMNLIGNAITMTPKHGEIRCLLGEQGSLGMPALRNLTSFVVSSLKTPVRTSNHVILSIQDNGLGFTEEDVSHLFHRFAANRGRNPMGIGLGLYNAYQVIRAHGGVIWVETTEGEGAAVNFSFPKGIPDNVSPNNSVGMTAAQAEIPIHTDANPSRKGVS